LVAARDEKGLVPKDLARRELHVDAVDLLKQTEAEELVAVEIRTERRAARRLVNE
jgi:hypothetical protein